MKITKLKLTDLKRPERNVRMHTDKQIVEFKRSVQMFGQIRPIVVDENHVIIAGNGLYDTLLALEHETADCYIVTGLSENEKKKLMLADNRIYSLGTDDLEAFEALLDDLKDDLDIPGFDEDLLASLVADTDQVTQLISEYGSLDEEDKERIQEGGQRQEADIQRAEQQPNHLPIAQPNQGATAQASISCPKCGEQIWL